MDRLKLPEPDNKEISKNNLVTILQKYFDNELGDIEWLKKQSIISLNQIEHVAILVSENLHFFQKEWPKGTTVSNVMRYGVDALRIDLQDDFEPSRPRKELIDKFRTHLFLRYKKRRKNYNS